VPRSGTRPSAMMRSLSTARSPRTASRPVPSQSVAPRMTRSAIERTSSRSAPPRQHSTGTLICTVLPGVAGRCNRWRSPRGGSRMKFSWFHLMPYRWLPADFRERYHGVWVDVPNRLYDPERGHQLYNEYLDMLEYAGELGFDALGVNEHHQNAYGMMPSPNLMAAALARRTKAMLLILGNSIALYNPPVRVAEELAMLDVMSGGR